MRRNVTALIAVLTLTTMPLRAAAPDGTGTDKKEFEESITVTASPIEEESSLDNVGGRVDTVTAEQIENLNAQDLATALRRVPGVVTTRYNAIGSYGGADGGAVFIRGHGMGRPGAQILTSVDGIPRYVGVWTHPLLDTLSIDLSEKIRILKTPQPVLFGNMAFGVVDMVPRRGAGLASGRLRLQVGENSTFIGIGEGGAAWHGGDVFATLSHRESDGHRPNSAGRVDAGSVNLGLDAGAGWDLRLFLSGTDSWAEDPGREGAPSPPITPRFEDSDLFSVLTAGRNLDDGGRLEFKAYIDSGSIDWSQWDGDAAEAFVSATDWDNSGFRIRFIDNPWEGGTLQAGLDHDLYGGTFVEKRPAESGQVTDETFRNTSLWVLVRHDFGGALHVTPSAGVRWTDTRHFGGQWGAQIGLEVTAGRTKFYANGARAFNLPGVWTAVLYNGWNRQGQWQDLDPEILVHWEIGAMGHAGPNIDWNLSYFHDQTTDALRFAPPPPFPPSFVNVADSTVNGVEGSLGWRPLDRLALYGGATWSDADPEETPDLPEWTFSGGLNWQVLPWLGFNLDMESLDDRWVLSERWPSPREKLDGYTLVNARVVGTLSPGGITDRVEVFLAGENLGNDDYAYRPGYSMPGRTWMLGLNLGFR